MKIPKLITKLQKRNFSLIIFGELVPYQPTDTILPFALKTVP